MSDKKGQSSNRLAGETSPYLLQHAHNPVDWYPWGPEALERARTENRPILLSIGYAACHWCHVMERESFEDDRIAGVMNERFVCIKVDREERPDIDSIYMDALMAMTGRGGWPMTMFLTPDAKPFFGGTYFPPDDRHGMPSFGRILDAVHDAWQNRQEEIGLQTEAIVEHIQGRGAPVSSEPLEASLLGGAVRALESSFDSRHGGFGPAPKFPQAPILELLLRTAAKNMGRSREMLDLTLTRMARQGMYDQIGGGFHRYSVDERWLVPHFEKMLYDNAQLARVYTRAWQLTGSELFRRIAEETLDYLLRDMTLPTDAEGLSAFFASEDADSEGEEGKFYVWDANEFMAIAPEAADFYGITGEGNFEGRNILTAAEGDPPLAARDKLLRARGRRIRPGRDEKILVSWNALTISALAEASAAFGRSDFAERALATAHFVLTRATDPSGRLMHSYKDGRAQVPGMLEDYAYLCEALLALWEVSFDPHWLEECRRLSGEMIRLFSDPERGDFYATGEDHEKLIIRPKELIDGATPSPNGVASLLLQKLSVLTGDVELAERGVAVLRSAHVYMSQVPQAAGTLLSSLDFYVSTPREIVILGTGPRAEAFRTEVWRRYLPNKVLAGASDPKRPLPESPMLEGKAPLDGSATAFLCENYSCRAPTDDPSELARQLSSAART